MWYFWLVISFSLGKMSSEPIVNSNTLLHVASFCLHARPGRHALTVFPNDRLGYAKIRTELSNWFTLTSVSLRHSAQLISSSDCITWCHKFTHVAILFDRQLKVLQQDRTMFAYVANSFSFFCRVGGGVKCVWKCWTCKKTKQNVWRSCFPVPHFALRCGVPLTIVRNTAWLSERDERSTIKSVFGCSVEWTSRGLHL